MTGVQTCALPIFGSIAAGGLFTLGNSFQHWLEPVVARGFAEPEPNLSPLLVSLMALVAVAIGFVVAFRMYGKKEVPQVAPSNVSVLTKVVRRDLLQDTINETLFMRPGQVLTQLLVFIDDKIIDGIVNGVAGSSRGISNRIRRIQTGYVRTYALLILIGAAVLLAVMLGTRL